MKKQIIPIALGLALLPAFAFAADFSGAWVRDGAKSDPVSFPLYWISRNPPPPPPVTANQPVITVRQTSGAVEVTDPQRPQRTLALDGRPRTVPTTTGLENATVTAALQGESLVVETVQPFGGMPGNVSASFKETWTLSPDGKVLTIATVRSLPAETRTFTQVYNRQQ